MGEHPSAQWAPQRRNRLTFRLDQVLEKRHALGSLAQSLETFQGQVT
jgi:hypothetical protein